MVEGGRNVLVIYLVVNWLYVKQCAFFNFIRSGHRELPCKVGAQTFELRYRRELATSTSDNDRKIAIVISILYHKVVVDAKA
jgi:hypothetical protein